MNAKIISEEYADLIVENNSTIAKANKESLIYLHPRFSMLNIPIAQIDKCSIGQYGYNNIPNCYTIESLTSLEKSGITKIQNNPNLDLQGQGVLIGVIDTGIDYQHEAFINSDRTSKIVSLWDQTINDDNNDSQNVIYGTEYSKDIINEALSNQNPLTIVPSKDELGHGTMISGIVVGNESINNDFRGVAPKAELVVVKLKQAKKIIRNIFAIPMDAICYQETDILIGINYVINIAKQLKKPIVLCMPLGSSQGAHDGNNLLSAYLSFLNESPGIAVVISGGNEGASRRHYYGTINTQTKYDEFELSIGANESGISMEIWQSAPYLLKIEGTSPSGDNINPIEPSRSDCKRLSLVFERTIIYINNIISEAESGDQLILFRFEFPTEGIWKFRVTNIEGLTSNYNVWLPSGNFITESTFLLNSSPNITLTEPANAFYPIVITAYNHLNDSIWANSSRGYTRINTVKPDLAAPGVNLVCPIINNKYGRATGTGAAAAHCAGAAAMLLEWGIVKGNYPTMHGIEVRQLLVRGAKRESGIIYPNNIWGYGVLDIFNTFSSLR